ncbi:MAG TPA: alpha-galactosidase [Phycisphaerae bacterium]|nr:alpha-galactosidase [Phycisphaerae bacterium]HRW54724.1 alpha-galactosidase [Phycisphaerae bacterium]
MSNHLTYFAVLLPLAGAIAETRPDWLIDASPYVARCDTSADGRDIALDNGLVRRRFRIAPDGATVAFDNLMTDESLLRAIKPEAIVTIDGNRIEIGGLAGQPNLAYLTPQWTDAMTPREGALHYVSHNVDRITPRFPWRRVRHCAPNAAWPPAGVHLRMDYAPTPSDDGATSPPTIRVSVHYALCDGIPLLSKWLTIQNTGDAPITIDSFTSELLAVPESPAMPSRSRGPAAPTSLHVETDYALIAGNENNCLHTVHWTTDPDYTTQVDYELRTPCLLQVRPEMGPAETLTPGASFETFRAFELVFDSTDAERRSLALRRMYRTIAPWTTENPLMLHVRFADRESVERAIDQCADVGFEMVILSFGSGFDIENGSARYLAEMKGYADYARQRGVEIGGYSLLASRTIGPDDDVVMPEGMRPVFGHSPCLCSSWGDAYFQKLREFYEQSGFTLLEHDGSYPGDVCASTTHPGHRGLADSRWKQWRRIAAFYQWCRARGVYLNVPDWYYLAGANKYMMGYRETNWSLPRAQQLIHTRQNIYDGTWQRTPSMGWMFVPLSEYHGGGAAATIEPLHEHIDHYRRMIRSNLAFGVQACYRGPRLYDTKETRDMIAAEVAWFRKYRDILESDLIHGRRADGRRIDWSLHVNPTLKTKGMVVAFNPLESPASETLRVNLYYTGLTKTAHLRRGGGAAETVELDRSYCVDIPIELPANGFGWIAIE